MKERSKEMLFAVEEKVLSLYLMTKRIPKLEKKEESYIEHKGIKFMYELYENKNTAIFKTTTDCDTDESLKKLFEQKVRETQKEKKCFLDITFDFTQEENEVYIQNTNAFLETYKETLPKDQLRFAICTWCQFPFWRCGKELCSCDCPCIKRLQREYWYNFGEHLGTSTRDFKAEE